MKKENIARYILFLLYIGIVAYTNFFFLINVENSIYKNLGSEALREMIFVRLLFFPILSLPAILFFILSRKRKIVEILLVGIPVVTIFYLMAFGIYVPIIDNNLFGLYIFTFFYPIIGFYLTKRFLK